MSLQGPADVRVGICQSKYGCNKECTRGKHGYTCPYDSDASAPLGDMEGLDERIRAEDDLIKACVEESVDPKDGDVTDHQNRIARLKDIELARRP